MGKHQSEKVILLEKAPDCKYVERCTCKPLFTYSLSLSPFQWDDPFAMLTGANGIIK
jgi:hypothetical protein